MSNLCNKVLLENELTIEQDLIPPQQILLVVN